MSISRRGRSRAALARVLMTGLPRRTARGVGLASAAATAVGVHLLVGRTAWRSGVGAVALMGLLVATGWVLLPRQVDRHESFVEEPNERSTCAGWSFRHYPPETFDAAVFVSCVGLESPLPTAEWASR